MDLQNLNGLTPNISSTITYPPSTRADKTKEFLTDAFTPALLTGLQIAGKRPTASTTTMSEPVAPLVLAAGRMSSAASLAGGIIGGVQIAMNWGRSTPAAGASSGLALGASIGTLIAPGVGTALGAGIGTVIGGLIGCITSGKHRDQKARDSVREELVRLGVLDSNYTIPLADGSLFDLGKDGGARAELGGRRPFEVDFSNPLAQYAVGWMSPIIALLSPSNRKIKDDFTGYFANAALQNAKDLQDVRNNINSFLPRFGLTNESLKNGIQYLAQSHLVDADTAHAWISGIAQRVDTSFTGEFQAPHESSNNPEKQERPR